MTPKNLVVEAGVRYWEGATVNGVEDTDGTLIPFRCGDKWCPIIDLQTGVIQDWPEGVEADIHYKVCDAGQYWLQDHEEVRRWNYQGDYVPDILSPEETGYGDYIIIHVFNDGSIRGWNGRVDLEDWENGKEDE
jgi:hypothetical protein